MPGRLPADFNDNWYLETHPDVALSGLGPREHYLRFGKLMGRRSKPAAPLPAPIKEPAAAKSIAGSMVAQIPAKSEAAPDRSHPLIDRPPDFDPTAVEPGPAPAKAMADSGGIIDLQTLASGPFAAPERGFPRAPLFAYAQMMALPPLAGQSGGEEVALSGAGAFQAGETRIENAWFADDSKLRLMIAGGTAAEASCKGWALRAYQAAPATAGELKMAGQGVQLPAAGPVFCDIEMVHPLMPLLLELSDADGVTQEIGIWPFPSLLPGGLHGSELLALQTEADPMDAFWSLSDVLLREFLGHPDWPERSITNLSVRLVGTTGAEPLFSPSLQEWLAAIFGLALRPWSDGEGARPGEAKLRDTLNNREALCPVLQSRLSSETAADGLNLLMPIDCVPTISALVSRRLGFGRGVHAAGPFVVAEAANLRPRWSVVPSADREPGPHTPVLQPINRITGAKKRWKVAPIHLAIALRPANSAVTTEAVPAAVAGPLPLTVVLEASDLTRSEVLVPALREAAGLSGVELLVRPCDQAEAFRGMLDGICGSNGWTEVPRNSDLRDLARAAHYQMMLTISDRISLDDSRTLPTLCAFLHGDSTVASASCLLLAEKIIKKNVVLEPATGGLFPSHISFASAPRLSFAEPDVHQALPNMTYPVVANTLLFTVWRSSALAELPMPSGPVSATATDIRLGLDLMQAGYCNLCTSQVKARLSGPYARRDAIDPVGSAYLQPERWEDILSRVTVVRELF